MMKKAKKFLNAFLITSFCLLSHTNYGQTNDIAKIENTLQKNLVGSGFLGGIYDSPCYNIAKITISETGEIVITGSEKGCNVTFSIRDATITYDRDSRIQIYQATPRINITFYTKNAAVVYKAIKDFKIIVSESLTALPLSAQDATIFNDEGVKLKEARNSAAAMVKFKEAIKLKPDYTEALYNLGWCQNDTKDYTGAIISLRKARDGWSTIAKVHFELAYAFEKTNMTDSAIRSYNTCLLYKDDYSLAYKQLGYISYEKKEYGIALLYFAKYEAAAKASITDYQYWYRKGFMYNAQKNYETAKLSLTKSLQFKKDYINTYLELGFSASKLKQNDEAIGYFNKAIEIDPKSHIPYNGIGEVYKDNLQDRLEAINWYNKSLAINPNERKANYGIGYCLNSLQKCNEAIPFLKRSIQYENTYTVAYVELGYSYYKTNNYDLALINFNKAIELNPKNENARYYAGLVYIAQKNITRAQQMVDELKALSSKNAAGLQEKVNKM